MAHVDQAPDGKPKLTVSDADDLLQWLETRKDRRDGTWLVRGRRGSQHPRLEYEDVIRVLLTVGWVDATMRMLDEGRSLLWISPRRRGSVWSRQRNGTASAGTTRDPVLIRNHDVGT